jgi:hypothetical protein
MTPKQREKQKEALAGLSKKRKDAIKFSFEKYKKAYEKAKERNNIREGAELLNFSEYVVAYNLYEELEEAIAQEGGDVKIHDLIVSDASEIEEPTLRGLQRVLAYNGVKVSLEVIRDNQQRYFKTARSFYPDDESYDLALSEAFGW